MYNSFYPDLKNKLRIAGKKFNYFYSGMIETILVKLNAYTNPL
jgi:hypothetical protein